MGVLPGSPRVVTCWGWPSSITRKSSTRRFLMASPLSSVTDTGTAMRLELIRMTSLSLFAGLSGSGLAGFGGRLLRIRLLLLLQRANGAGLLPAIIQPATLQSTLATSHSPLRAS